MEVVINTICVRPLRGAARVALIITRITNVVLMVAIVQGRALRDLEISEEFCNDNDHTMIVTLSVYEDTLPNPYSLLTHHIVRSWLYSLLGIFLFSAANPNRKACA
jgi:hypothetical protein